MARIAILSALGAAAALSAVSLAAAGPTVFAKSKIGLWELSGIEGNKVPVRICIADLGELSQIEHKGRACNRIVVRQAESTVTYSYKCGPSDFGQSKIDFITPQNFRIDTQGIAGGLPFAYVAQARRLGDCSIKTLPSTH